MAYRKDRFFIILLFFTCILFTVLPQENVPLVSVLHFSAQGVSENDAATIARLFEVELIASKQFRVVEQEDADKILETQKKSLSGCTDEACAVEIGKLLSAEQVVIGSVSRLDDTIIVTAKLVDVERGENISAGTIKAAGFGAVSDALKDLAGELLPRKTAGIGGLVFDDVSEKDETAGPQSADRATVTFAAVPEKTAFTLYNILGEEIGSYMTPKALPLAPAVYRIKAHDPDNLYFPFEDEFYLSAGGKVRYEITLKPNFGSVLITSDPSGADVILNGVKLGTTPYTQERLTAGDYQYVLKAEYYDSAAAVLSVVNGETAAAYLTLTPAYVLLKVREAQGMSGEVVIDGHNAGQLPYDCKLPFGDFDLKIVPDDTRYYIHEEQVIVRTRGESIEKTISLKGRYGDIFVEGIPYIEGTVYVDNEPVGLGPDTFPVLIGDHTVKMEGKHEKGFLSGEEKITVGEGELVNVSLKMATSELQKKLDKWNVDLADFRGLVERKYVINDEDIGRISEIIWEIERTDFPLEDIAAEAREVLAGMEVLKKEQDLARINQANIRDIRTALATVTAERDRLQRLLNESENKNKTRTGAKVAWFVTGGIGLAGMGASLIIGDILYKEYNSLDVSDTNIEELHITLDILGEVNITTGAVGGVCVLLGLITPWPDKKETTAYATDLARYTALEANLKQLSARLGEFRDEAENVSLRAALDRTDTSDPASIFEFVKDRPL